MIIENISLGESVDINQTSSINNAIIGNNVKIAGFVRIYGKKENLIEIGGSTYVGPNSLIDGYNAKVIIGKSVSIAQSVIIISGSGPNASKKMQKIFPIKKGPINIGDHTWIGASVIIMPNITIGKFCVIAANSFVSESFPDYSILGGSPAKLIRVLSDDEILQLNQD
jgi:acetyltransferase-like isoleucine patch superfamily enzyme